MKIQISKEVRALLPQDKHQFILTANDGSNPFSNRNRVNGPIARIGPDGKLRVVGR